MKSEAKTPNIVSHLDRHKIINLGSFYTPEKFVDMAYDWLVNIGINDDYVILDSSCGYGAFFNTKGKLANSRFIGNDIDEDAIQKMKSIFPNVETYCKNSLVNVSRREFGINDDDKLVVVGNPPYNDTTSQIGQKEKKDKMEFDSDIKSRDLGISSLLTYNKLKADYCVILHPLSYLIKKANFRACSKFFGNYSLENHIVFSSAEFANTSKMNGFPIIMGLYKRSHGQGLKFEDVKDIDFKTVEDNTFRISKRDYIADYVSKYPTHSKRYNPEILFYTLRDINALKRSRTFIQERIANAVDVDPDKLDYYCYIDCFKKYATIPYYLGNFDIPFTKDDFADYSNLFMKVSKANHPEIFSDSTEISDSDISSVKAYIDKAVSFD